MTTTNPWTNTTSLRSSLSESYHNDNKIRQEQKTNKIHNMGSQDLKRPTEGKPTDNKPNKQQPTWDKLNLIYQKHRRATEHEPIITDIAKTFGISDNCAWAVFYVSEKSRGTEAHLSNLILAAKNNPSLDYRALALTGDEATTWQKQ